MIAAWLKLRAGLARRQTLMPSVMQPWVAEAGEEAKVQGEAEIEDTSVTVIYLNTKMIKMVAGLSVIFLTLTIMSNSSYPVSLFLGTKNM